MAPHHRIHEHVPNVKAMARLALAGSWPKPKRAHSNRSSICVPAFGSPQTTAKKVNTHSKFRSQRKRIMDGFSKIWMNMPLRRHVCERTFSDEKIQSETSASSPSMSLHRTNTDSTATTGHEDNSTETSISTPSTRASSPDIDPEFVPKCLIPQGRHPRCNAPSVPANSISSSISGRTDETPHCPRRSRCCRHQIISREPFTALENLKRLEREITAYHKALGRGNQDSAQTLLKKYGVNISLHTLKATERAQLVSCIYRRAYDFETSLIPSPSTPPSKQLAYPKFFPALQTVNDFDWKYYDHEGNIRPEAYVAMAEATGEEGLFTWKELDKLQMEGFRDARFEMGEFWWKEVEGWVLGVEGRVDEMGKEVRGK